MPSQAKITRADVIDTALRIVRANGWNALSARSIASEMKSSTMPIYSHFRSMEDLEEEVVKKIMALLAEYESKPHTGTLALNHGIGYVLFAWEEPHLFAAINDEKHVALQFKYGDSLFDTHVQELSMNPSMEGYAEDELRYFQFLAWTFVHGIASMRNWIRETQGNFDEEKLIHLIRDGSKILTAGFLANQTRSLTKKEEKEGV